MMNGPGRGSAAEVAPAEHRRLEQSRSARRSRRAATRRRRSGAADRRVAVGERRRIGLAQRRRAGGRPRPRCRSGGRRSARARRRTRPRAVQPAGQRPPPGGQRDRQLEPLADVAHLDPRARTRTALSPAQRVRPEAVARLRLEAGDLGVAAPLSDEVAQVRRRYVFLAWNSSRAWSSPTAEKTPGRGGTSTRRMPELARERGGVDRAAAAERDEREVARVAAALDRHRLDRADHARVRQLVGAVRRVEHVQPERLGDVALERPLGASGRRRAASSPSSSPRRVEVAEQQVGVGDRRLVAALAVADGTGIGARGARARPWGRRPGRARSRLPPPAPTSARSMNGTLSAYPPPLESRLLAEIPAATSNSAVKCGRPPSTSDALAVVPPMSNVMTAVDARAAARARRAAMTPGGRPDFDDVRGSRGGRRARP